jgi:hypothetical protein
MFDLLRFVSAALQWLANLTCMSSMRAALNTIAELLGVAPVVHETSSTRGRRVVETLLYCDWASLRYPHTLALRTLLAERYKVATANKTHGHMQRRSDAGRPARATLRCSPCSVAAACAAAKRSRSTWPTMCRTRAQ